MQEGLSTRARIAILIYSMTNAVLFGIGIVTVLNVPSLAAHAVDRHTSCRGAQFIACGANRLVHRASPARPLLAAERGSGDHP